MHHTLYEIVYLPAIEAMEGNRGRMMVQGGHGFLHAFFDAEKRFPEAAQAYRDGIAFKVALQCSDETELLALYERYNVICGATKVIETGSRRDGQKGRTRTLTGIGLGPLREDLIGDDLRALARFE